jgi:hypothetical protein
MIEFKPTNYAMKSFMRNLRQCEAMPVYPAHTHQAETAYALESKGRVIVNRENPDCMIVTLRNAN